MSITVLIFALSLGKQCVAFLAGKCNLCKQKFSNTIKHIYIFFKRKILNKYTPGANEYIILHTALHFIL